MILSIFILSLIGLCISVYAYFTEKKLQENPNYHPACDISDRISCSKPMQSQYGKLFFVSNSFAGMIFYIAMAIAALMNAKILVIVGAAAAFCMTLYLAYLLYFKIKSFCVVCTSLYLVNILLLILSLQLL